MNHGMFVITRGDDLGSTSSANKAIFEGMTKGNLKNTSIMMTCPHIQEAAEMFASRKEFCVGLHATINAEWDTYKWKTVLPQSEVPDLYDENNNLFNDNMKLHQNNPSIGQVMAELNAQLELATKMGFDIKYVDQHMCFDWTVAGLVEEFEYWCKQKGLINGMAWRNGLQVKNEGGIENHTQNVIHALKVLEEGIYIFVGHPSFDDKETKKLYHKGETGEMVASSRNADRMIFTNPEVLKVYEERGIKAVRYDEV